MKYKALCYITMVLIIGAPASAVQISQGTEIGLKDVNSTVKISEDIETSKLAVYGNKFSFGTRNISFYYKNNSKAYVNLTDYNKSLNNPFTFSIDVDSSKTLLVVLKGFNDPVNSYKISAGNTSKVFETGSINTSFELDPGKYDFTADNYDTDDTDSSDSESSTEESTETSESHPTTSENNTKDTAQKENVSKTVYRAVRFRPENLNLTLDSRERKTVNLTLHSNLTANITGNLSLIGLGNTSNFNTSEITLSNSRPLKLSFTSVNVSSGVFKGLMLFNSSSVVANASISVEVQGELFDSIDFEPEENMIEYSLESGEIDEEQKVLLTVRNSEGDKIYSKKVAANNSSLSGSVSVKSLNTSSSGFILKTNVVDGDPEKPHFEEEKASSPIILVIGGLTLLVLAALALVYIGLGPIETEEVSNVKKEVRSSLEKLNSDVERDKARSRSRKVLNKLSSADSIPDISTFKVNEALEALENENYEELNAKLLELELLVDSNEDE